MFTPLQYIETRAPLFAMLPSINTLIEMATAETASYCDENATNKAIALLVCHWCALGQRDATGQGGAGAVKSMSEGELSVSYGTSSGYNHINPNLEQTRWGLELLDMRNSCIFAPRTRMM